MALSLGKVGEYPVTFGGELVRLPEGNLVNAERDDLSAEENFMPAGEILMVSGEKKQPVFGFQTGCFQVPNRLFSGRKQPV